MQAIFGNNGQHLLCSSSIVGSECVKCRYGLWYMQQKFETAADHSLSLAAKKRERERKQEAGISWLPEICILLS